MNKFIHIPADNRTITLERGDDAIIVVVGNKSIDDCTFPTEYEPHIMLSIDEDGNRVNLSALESMEAINRAMSGENDAGQ